MTANDVAGVPSVLRHRFRIIPFPAPGKRNLPELTRQIMTRVYVESGHDPRWVQPLEAVEIEALEENWPGGSLIPVSTAPIFYCLFAFLASSHAR